MPARRKQLNVARLPPFDEESGDLNAVVETIADSRNKFAYDEKLGLFRLEGVLPAGASFPFDFGFAPSTKGGDGPRSTSARSRRTIASSPSPLTRTRMKASASSTT